MSQKTRVAPEIRRRPFRPLGLSRDNALLALSTLLFGASFGFYQYVLPLFIASLGASPDQVGLALAIGNSGSVVSILIGGLFVDRYSYRWQMIVSWGMSVVATAIFVVAWSWEVVALALLLSTISLFGIPAFNAYIIAAREGQDTAEALTTVFVGFTAGQTMTPTLGGWLIATSGMPAMFLASLACMVASTVAVVLVRERRSAPADKPPEGASPRRRWQLGEPFRAYRTALDHGSLRGLLLVLAILYVATFTGVSLIPNYLHDRLGVEPAEVGLFGTGVAIVGIVGSLGLARVARRVGFFRTIGLAQGLVSGGIALILLAPGLGSYGVLAGGIGFSLRGAVQAQQTLSRAMIAGVVHGAGIGPAFALQSTAFNAAMVVGPALAGVFYTTDPALPLLLALGIGVPISLWLGVRSQLT
jgi:predicted MFS family arabinose efflux permease